MHPTAPQALAAALLALVVAPGPAAGEDGALLCAVTFSLPGRAAAPAPAGPVFFTTRPAAPAPSPDLAPAAAPAAEDLTPLHELARSLWSDHAPDSVREDDKLIPPEELATLVQRLCSAGQSQELADLSSFAPEARRALASLRQRPGFTDYAAWLQNQLDEMEAADLAQSRLPPLFVPPPPPPSPRLLVPYYELWLERVSRRPRPERAEKLLPALRAAFAAEGVPVALVWLAETESSFNPRARSPAGARGLFQLMPDTARGLGLDLWPDERVHPVRSARAAAAYLRHLHGRFGDWPLALAAYNAGESRVARELRRREAGTFASIAGHLPVETRFYVPKVLATIEVREGVAPSALAAPRI